MSMSNERIHELVKTIKHSDEAPPAYGEDPTIETYRETYSLAQIMDILEDHSDRIYELERQKEPEDKLLEAWQVLVLLVVALMSIAVIAIVVADYGK